MNRTVFIVWLLVFYLALVAGWSVHAHNGHPVSDNMCGAHNYGNCYVESDWIRGYYDNLRHTEPQLPANSREEGWRNFNGRRQRGRTLPGSAILGNPLCRRILARRKRRARRIKHVTSNLSG